MLISLYNKLRAKGLIIICVLSFGFSQAQNGYVRYVDSADNHIDVSSTRAQQFLDSIPKPIHEHIKGRMADYYAIKSLIHNNFNESADEYHSNILALKYAEKEENYEVAGRSCLELFSILYYANHDSIAYSYLKKAKRYYELCHYENGLLEVEQRKEYAKFLDGDYQASNKLIHKNLEKYKGIEGNAYYYMFALYMLTSNYLYLGDFDKAYTYFYELKTLKNNETIVKYNYDSFEATLNICFADVHYNRKDNDSTLHYLSLAKSKRSYMGEDTIKDYLGLYANIYNRLGEIELSKAYLDSLRNFEQKVFKDMVDSGLQINETLLKTESELKEESEKKYFFGFFGIAIFGILIILSAVYFLFYRKQKMRLHYLNSENRNLSHLKSTHEKLTAKVQGLEDYINSLKNKVKVISSVNDVVVQKEMIKEFYKDLHLRSSTIIEESNNHLDLVNDFNISFFNKLKELYPQLSDSEIIICYHIFVGFKNKEIALFLNTSVRAVESKRYRISKKLDFDKNAITLVEFLKQTFEE